MRSFRHRHGEGDFHAFAGIEGIDRVFQIEPLGHIIRRSTVLGRREPASVRGVGVDGIHAKILGHLAGIAQCRLERDRFARVDRRIEIASPAGVGRIELKGVGDAIGIGGVASIDRNAVCLFARPLIPGEKKRRHKHRPDADDSRLQRYLFTMLLTPRKTKTRGGQSVRRAPRLKMCLRLSAGNNRKGHAWRICTPLGPNGMTKETSNWPYESPVPTPAHPN